MKVRNNLLDEMNPQWGCIVSKNMRFQQIFRGTERRVKKFFNGKRIWKTGEKIKF